jgi:hypothetical protein
LPEFPVRLLRRAFSSRQLSQNLVEFGLSIAAVAFVAMVGFGALGRAQAAYWGGPAVQTLVQPTPPPGTFMHTTRINVFPTDFQCAPSSIILGQSVTCTIIVRDTSQAPTVPSWPQGTAAVTMDTGATSTCTLVQIPSTPTSTCHVSWTASSPSDVGTRTATPLYAPNDNVHLASTSNPSVQFVVHAIDVVIDQSTGCNIPWTPPQAPWRVEIGHPAICTATALDHTSHQKVTDAPADLTWTNNSSALMPLFTCFTHNNYAALNGCQPPATTYTCTTDTSGTCSVVFREYPANDVDALSLPGSTITLTAANLLGGPGVNSATAQVQILQPTSDHGSGFSVDCQSAAGVSYDPATWPDPIRGLARGVPSVGTIHVLGATAPALTCTVVVYDPSASASFDTPPPCPNVASPTLGCNADDQDSYPPFGDAGLADSSGHTWFCPGPGLNTSSHPVNMPTLYTGQPEYASKCQVTIPAGQLQAPTGPLPSQINLYVFYNGENVPFQKQHVANTSTPITVKFE